MVCVSPVSILWLLHLRSLLQPEHREKEDDCFTRDALTLSPTSYHRQKQRAASILVHTRAHRQARSDKLSRYRSLSSIFGCDLWLLFSRGHSHLGDDGHIDLINSFIYCQSLPFILTHTHQAKTHRFTAGITQLSASSIPHLLLHVCFSVSLLFFFFSSPPQATSPSPLLSARFNPFHFGPRSRSFYQHRLSFTWQQMPRSMASLFLL